MNESYPNLISFVIAHPFISLLLSWPAALIIISVCWTLATTLSNAYNTTANLVSQFIAYGVILIRGYAPVPPYCDDEEDDDSDSRSKDNP